MRSAKLSDFLMRDSVLALLSDDETGRVSRAEAGPRLKQGDEYLDLDHLDLGVQSASANAIDMGHVLPRSAVREPTWTKILALLPSSGGARTTA